MHQLANNCGNLSFYYACFSSVIVSRCFSLSVAHFWSSKKAKLTVTHNVYWSALKSQLLLHSQKLFLISGLATTAKEAKTCLFWDFVIIIRMVSSLPNCGSYPELFAVCFIGTEHSLSHIQQQARFTALPLYTDPCGQ